MSYSLVLLRVPPGTPEEEVETIADAINQAEIDRPPRPPDPEAEQRKRALADALLAAYPELEGGEPNYAKLAAALRITEHEARQRHHEWELDGPMDGAGIQIVLYDTWVHISMPSSGVEGDWEELWGYLEVLVREGGFIVFDPQGPDVVDLAAGPFGDDARGKAAKQRKPRRTKPREGHDGGRDEADEDEAPGDRPRVSEIGKLIDRIADDALGDPLAAAGFVKDDNRTWRRYDADVIQVVCVNGPRRNEGTEAVFTLNVGCYFPPLEKEFDHIAPTAKPMESECHVRKFGSPGWTVRLPKEESDEPERAESRGLSGDLFAWLRRRRGLDRRRRTLEQHARATRRLREELQERALPWLERMGTLRGVRDDEVRQGRFLGAARMSLALGERDEAARFVDRALARALAERRPHDREKILDWARRRGFGS